MTDTDGETKDCADSKQQEISLMKFKVIAASVSASLMVAMMPMHAQPTPEQAQKWAEHAREQLKIETEMNRHKLARDFTTRVECYANEWDVDKRNPFNDPPRTFATAVSYSAYPGKKVSIYSDGQIEYARKVFTDAGWVVELKDSSEIGQPNDEDIYTWFVIYTPAAAAAR